MHMNETLPGPQLLHELDQGLHTSYPVELRQSNLAHRKEATSQKPREKIAAWLPVLDKIYSYYDQYPAVAERIKQSLYKDYIITPENVPDSYFKKFREIAKERGMGDITITSEIRNTQTDILIADQKSSFNLWLDYLSSPDSSHLPNWAKYWAFKGMLKLSTYDKENHTFGKRSKHTVSPFPYLNREALSKAVEILSSKVNHGELDDDEELDKRLKGFNFGGYYSCAIKESSTANHSELENTEGVWIKYKKGSNHIPLVQSLKGYGTGWCTAAESTARAQLAGGDFHVYYSDDSLENPTTPRIAIRMQGNKIAEIRGIGKDQNMDPFIGDVLESKLTEFGEAGALYNKKVSDMKRVTEISKKNRLTKEDLRFLYEIDDNILGFGYDKDPRIQELLDRRDLKEDLSYVLGYEKDQISITTEEALSGNIKFHYGNLDLRGLTSAEGLGLPESVGGNLDLRGLTSSEGLELPESVGGDLFLNGLTSAKELKLPKSVRGSLYLNGLTSAKELKLPESVGGYLFLNGLTSAEGLELPESVGGDLFLNGI